MESVYIKKFPKVFKTINNSIKENKAVFIAVLILMLCFGLMKQVETVINNTLLYLTDFKRNSWIDCVAIILTVCSGITVYSIIKDKKIVAPRTVSLILLPLVLFLYFRIAEESPYIFTAYWDGPVCYLDGFAFLCCAVVGLFTYQQVKKIKILLSDKEDTDAGIYSFDLDAPIEAADKDMFQMDSLVKRIVNYIAFTDVSKSAFSMGIVGEWGDGKTSLMNLVEEKIKNEHQDFIIVRYNPRGSKKADLIQEDFLESLKQALTPKHTGIDRTIDSYAVALDLIPGVPPPVSKAMDLLQIHVDKEREANRTVLRNAIGDIGCRIVVMIDDLDRLTGEELIEVLKVLDTNGAFPNMVFLTSFDKAYVNTVLNNYLQLGNQVRTYTDKYFTVEINVPLHPSFRLMDYLVTQLTAASKSGFIKQNAASIEQCVRNQFNYIMPRLRTIRDIKRFANQFLYDYAEVQSDVYFRDFLLLELIKFSHPEDYEALYRLRFVHKGKSSFLMSSSDELFYLNDELLPKKNRAGDAMEEPAVKPDSMDILSCLFPTESLYREWYAGRYQKIYSASSFEHYFYNYEYSHLKTEDFDRLFIESSFDDVRKLIDGWTDFSKDLETFLLTRDINSIKSKTVLRRFMQVLLYSSHKQSSISYWGQNYSFLRKEDVGKILKNCGFDSESDYLAWFKETMEGLSAIDPMIPSNYLRAPISGLLEGNTDPNLFIMSVNELQEYSLRLFKSYLATIDEQDWDVNKAYFMSQIPYGADNGFLPEANTALHDSMMTHFSKYSASFPFFVEDFSGAGVGYTIKFRFKSLFANKEEFEMLIQSKDNDDAPEIEMIRAIWPLYKANDCNNFALPQGMGIEEAKETMLKAASEYLEQYDEINKKLDDLTKEWWAGDKKDSETFVLRVEGIRKELSAIPLKLKIAETYDVQMQDMINVFKKKYE